MPQPTPFHRSFSFTDFQASNPASPPPGYQLDAELDNAAATLQGVLGNLKLIQRDDGKLADDCVTIDSIAPSLFNAIVEAAGGGDYLSPNLSFSVHTLAPGAAATIAMTGEYPDLAISLGIPKGDAAAPGAATLEDADYGDVVISGGGSVFTVQSVGGTIPSMPGHHHTIDSIDGLADALSGKAPAGSYATTQQLAQKADAVTAVGDWPNDLVISDGYNNVYFRATGGTSRTWTFPNVAKGVALIIANRATVNMTIACPGGYYKNGAAAASTANLSLAPGGRLTAFHEGGGVWTFDGTGF